MELESYLREECLLQFKNQDQAHLLKKDFLFFSYTISYSA